MRVIGAALVLMGAVAGLGALGRSEGAIQKTWDEPAGITRVVVEGDEQDIRVQSGGERVTGRVLGDRSDDITVTRKDGVFTVTVKADHGWLFGNHRASRVELTVPEGIDLDLTTASGAILVAAKVGQLTARSASGDIEAPQGGKGADVDSTSGTIRLTRFTESVKASALSGDVMLEDLNVPVQATVLSGALRLRRVKLADGSRLSAVSGDVDVELADGVDAYRLTAESVSGGLRVGSTEAEQRLVVGSGGKTLTVKTVSGDIRVR